MSKKRQPETAEDRSEDRFEIRTLALNCPSGYIVHEHSHDWHQLIYASRGVMTVDTMTGSWVVPSHRAVWVPAHVEHRIQMLGAVHMRTLYIRNGLSPLLPAECCVVSVSPLLRELIVHTIQIGMLDRDVDFQKRLTGVILDQLQTLCTVPLKLSMPDDARALRVAEALREDPGDQRPLRQLAKETGASKRTIERLFQSETEMTFGKWRQQLRMLEALRLLAAGKSVTEVSLEIGYDSTSAFISAFKTAMGTTPGRYYQDGR